jgi:hypothetical protein
LQLLVPALGSLGTLLQGFDAAALAQLAVGAPVGPVLDLDQSLDIAVAHERGATDADPLVAASAHLVDGPATREAFEKHFVLVPVAGGMLRLRTREASDDGNKPFPCLIAPSDQASPGRLICAGSEGALHALAPYLASAPAPAASTADLRLELFVHEAVAAFDHDDDSADTADASFAFGKALGRQFLGDVSSLVLETGFDGSEADTTLTTTFATVNSPLSRAILSHASPNGRPPGIFERLPNDSAAAWYARGADVRDLEPLREALAPSLRTFMVEDGYTDGDVTRAEAVLGRLFLGGGAWVLAAGHRVDSAAAALDAYVAAGRTGESARAKARASLQGWVVVGIDDAPQKWTEGARTLADLDASKQPLKRALRVTPVQASLRLPTGTVHLEAETNPNVSRASAQKKPGGHGTPAVAHTMHVFVVPDVSSTWVALAEDPALAAAEIRAVLSPGPAGTLRVRPNLDSLRAEPTSAGGFISISEMAMLKLGEGGSDDELRSAHGVLQALASLPSGGTTPIPITVVSTPKAARSGAGGTVSVRVRVPASVVAELSGTMSRLF